MKDMLLSLFKSEKTNKIERTGDLAPKGVKTTIPLGGDYNEVWQHIHKSRQELFLKNLKK